MRRQLIAATVGGAALISAYGTAGAQVAIEVPGAGVYVGPTYHDDDDYYYSNRPRSYRGYGYYYDNAYGRRRNLRSDRNLCGRYSYWDGNACQPGRRP